MKYDYHSTLEGLLNQSQFAPPPRKPYPTREIANNFTGIVKYIYNKGIIEVQKVLWLSIKLDDRCKIVQELERKIGVEISSP